MIKQILGTIRDVFRCFTMVRLVPIHRYGEGWGDSPEWRLMEEVSTAVWPMLDASKIDARSRKIIGNDKTRYSLEETILRMQGMFPQYPPECVEEEVLNWLENQVLPNAKNRKAELRFETLMDTWIADYRKEHRR